MLVSTAQIRPRAPLQPQETSDSSTGPGTNRGDSSSAPMPMPLHVGTPRLLPVGLQPHEVVADDSAGNEGPSFEVGPENKEEEQQLEDDEEEQQPPWKRSRAGPQE
mgnify:CR=1 FL=1